MKSTILLACLFSMPLMTAAQSLTECIAFAKQHSLRIKAADLQQQRAQRNEGSYFELDKTELTLSQDPTSGGSPDNALTLSQNIDFPTVYTNRRMLLKAATAVETARTRLTENELVKEVSEVYTGLLLHRHEAELYKRNDSILAEFVRTAKIRFANGETNRLEVMNAEQLYAENQLRLQSALNDVQAQSDMLQAIMNADFAVTPTDHYIPSSLQGEDLPGQGYAYAITPQGELLNAERHLAERELRLTRQGYMPSFNVGMRHQCVIPGLNPYDVDRSRFDGGNWMGFEFGVAFPLFFGSQKARTAVARFDVEVANARLEEEANRAEVGYRAAYAKMVNAFNSCQQWMNHSVPNAQEIRRLSLVEYQAGEITYVEHIQNLNAALETELSAAQAMDELNKAIININFITGK